MRRVVYQEHLRAQLVKKAPGAERDIVEVWVGIAVPDMLVTFESHCDPRTNAHMCQMLNLLVPVRNAAIGPPVNGLRFWLGGEVQHQFRERFGEIQGTIFAGSGSKGCLCGFNDWTAFYEIARDAVERNGVRWLAAVHFWSGDAYDLSERTIDPYVAETCTPIAIGEVLIMHAEHPEQRRHRRVVRELGRLVGVRVDLRMKGGRDLHGTLTQFDAESEVGHVDCTTLVAQVLEVKRAADGPFEGS